MLVPELLIIDPVHVMSSKDRLVTQILPAMLVGRTVHPVPHLRVTEYVIEGLLPRKLVAENDSLRIVAEAAVVVIAVVVGAAVVVGDIDDLAVPSVQIVWKNDALSRIAPAKSAPVKLARFISALVRLAFLRIAFRKLALPKFAPKRFAEDRFAPCKFVPIRFAPTKFAPDKFTPDKFTPDRFPPCKLAFCSDAPGPTRYPLMSRTDGVVVVGATVARVVVGATVARVVGGVGAAGVDAGLGSATKQLSLWFSGSRLHASTPALPLDTIDGTAVIVVDPDPLIDPVEAFHENVPYVLLAKLRAPPAFSRQPFIEKLY